MPAFSWKSYIQKQRSYYREFTPVYNSHLNRYIHFNSSGFKHIVYKRGRSAIDIRQRLALLQYAVDAVKMPPVEARLEDITLYYVFVYEIEENLIIKVVVKKIGDRGILIF